MRLKEWAASQGVTYDTAWRWCRDDVMPVPFERTATGTIIVHAQSPVTVPVAGAVVAVYARVSSHDQREQLDAQVGRAVAGAAARGLAVSRVVTEVASGMNGNRARLASLLADPQVGTIVVEHRDRFGRMNTELVEAALAASGRTLVVLDDAEVEDDLVRDMTEVLTSFCARLYGRRSAENRAARAVEAATRG